MQSSAIFPLFYLPPVGYFSNLKAFEGDFLIEREEHFVKQTYRNRATIYSPNGPLDLIVPVMKGAKVHTKMSEVKISNDFNWQRLHWKSLESCYRNSAYFEYYEDEFYRFYEQRFDYLYDYNIEIMLWLLKQLKKNISLDHTVEYLTGLDRELDFRMKLSAKDVSPASGLKHYFQVFEDRAGFIPNLSIVDLLFNQGPQAKLYI